VNLVDSSGWIEYLGEGPNAEAFAALHEADDLVVPSITILEVYRYVLRERGRGEALTVAASMRQGRVVDLDEVLAIEAAELAVRLGLPLADSVIYATARATGSTLWTQDKDFKGLEGVEYRVKRIPK
jgi:predicted nucleic acid-binding protein